MIKKIEQINGLSILKISEIAINEEKRELYILEQLEHRITITDFELNFIKYFGSKGNGDNQFNYPSSICFKYQFLYVCDSYNKRIQKFNQNLEFIKLLKLEYTPYRLTVLNSELDVKSTDGATYFYDISSLNFNRKIDGLFSLI